MCTGEGVPQDSTFRPALFLIILNDVPDCSNFCIYSEDKTISSGLDSKSKQFLKYNLAIEINKNL